MGGIGGLISGIFGSNNKEAEKVDPYKTDSNAYNYGGTPGGAAAVAGGYRGYANNYNAGAANGFGQAYNSFADAQGARGVQGEATDLLRQRAEGNGLIATQVADQERRGLVSAGQSNVASARGPGGVALAGANNSAATAQGLANIGSNEQINAANEKLANVNALLGAGTTTRGQDIQTIGAGTGLGAAEGGLGLGYSGLENNVNQAQLAAQMNAQAQQSANYNAAHGITAGAAGQNASVNQQNGLALIGGIASGGSSLLGGGGPPKTAARGGALSAEGKPYLVGEQGPELVVPKKDGFVLTALQTAKMLGAPPTHQQMQGLSPGGRRALGGGMPARAAGGPVLTRSHAANGPPPGDPSAPRMQFDPRVGWYNPGLAPARDAEHDAAIATEAARDAEYADQDRRIAALPPKAEPETVKKWIEEDVAAAKGKKGEPGGPPSIVEIMAREQNNPRGSKVSRAGASLGSSLLDSARAVDTSYHAPGATAAPAIVALPEYRARAMGGDFDSGNGVILNKGGGLDAGASAKAMSDIATQYQRQGGSNPTSTGGGAAGALGALGGSFSNAAKGVDISFHPVGGEYARGGYMPAREEGGLIERLGAHVGRALGEFGVHGLASSVIDATKPEPIAIERKTPRAAVTSGASDLAVTRGDHTATYSRGASPAPTTRSTKVTNGVRDDDEARAKGGMMLAKGGRKRRVA